MLKELEVRVNRPPDILNLSHMSNLEKVNLKIEKNTSHVIINSGQNEKDSVPILQGFNLQNIVLQDQGLKHLCIDIREHQVLFDKMLPLSKDANDQFYKYFRWNVDKYIVRAKIIHQELNL